MSPTALLPLSKWPKWKQARATRLLGILELQPTLIQYSLFRYANTFSLEWIILYNAFSTRRTWRIKDDYGTSISDIQYTFLHANHSYHLVHVGLKNQLLDGWLRQLQMYPCWISNALFSACYCSRMLQTMTIINTERNCWHSTWKITYFQLSYSHGNTTIAEHYCKDVEIS